MPAKVKSCADAMSGLLQAFSSLIVVALLAPGIAVIVIAAHFPEARLVEGGELDALDPLGTLPEIELRKNDAERPAMFAADRLAVPAPRHAAGSRAGFRDRAPASSRPGAGPAAGARRAPRSCRSATARRLPTSVCCRSACPRACRTG